MASYEGSAVHIFLDNVAYPDELRKVLDQPDTKDLPLVVIPVAGEFRGGKSFLLSYFIRYLTKEGFGDEDEELIGFDHQQCRKPVTQGIKIWNKPLIVKKNHQDGSEQRIVVLLMDTQGILGGKEDNNMSTKVFALSTLLSSIMVFNLINQLNEGVLNYLKLFASYAKEAAEGIENEAPFQKLLILIRDWTKDENFGFYGGMEYLKEYFEDEKEEAFGSYFKETSCFLMPSPGKKVRKDNFNGCLRDLDEDFKQNLMTLIKGLCKPDHLAHFLKNVAGHTITAGQFCDYFGRCAKLVHKEDWTTSNDIVEMKSEFVCESAKHEALNVYSSNMDTNTDSFKTLITSSQLDVINKNARKEAKMRYTEKCKFPRSNAPQFFEKYMDKLMEELKQSFAVYEKQHQKELEARSMKDCDKAKEEAMGKYKSYMTTETKTKDLLTKGQLMKHDKDAKEKAGKIFNEKCRFYQANVRQTFDEYKKKLSEEMKQSFAVYEKEQQTKAKDHATEVFREVIEKMKDEFYDQSKGDFLEEIELQERVTRAVTQSDNTFDESTPYTHIANKGDKKRIEEKLERQLESAKDNMIKQIEEEYSLGKKVAAGGATVGVVGEFAALAAGGAAVLNPVGAIIGVSVGSLAALSACGYMGYKTIKIIQLNKMVSGLKLRNTQDQDQDQTTDTGDTIPLIIK